MDPIKRKKRRKEGVDTGYGKVPYEHRGSGRPAWRDVNYVKIYKMSQKGWCSARMAKELGVSKMAFTHWKNNNPAVRHAIRTGKLSTMKRGDLSYVDYVFQRLPPQVQEIWEQINKIGNAKNSAQMIDAIFDQNGGKYTRMHCWIHAYISNNYSKSAANRVVNITNGTLNNWLKDKRFVQLIQHMEESKKDMVEESLLNLVRSGDTAATIFAAKTLVKERGYDTSQKIQVEHKGAVEHKHAGSITMNMVNITDLDLPIEILEAIEECYKERAKKEIEQGVKGQVGPGPKFLPSPVEVQDAQYELVKPEEVD